MVKLEQTENKSFAQPKAKTTKNKQTKRKGSITKVNRKYTHGTGIWGGERKVTGIRIDNKLYKAFKPVARRVFGSVCRPVEALMATILAMQQNEVNFGNTIHIDKQFIVRNIRPRRKMDWEAADVGFEVTGVCGYCEKPFDGNAYHVEYVSHMFDSLCPDCYKHQHGRGVVLKIVSRLVRK